MKKKARAKYEAIVEKNHSQIVALEATIDGIKKKITESTKNNRLNERTASETDLKVALARLKELKVEEHRYTVQDATVEKFGILLAQNPNGLGVVFDEMIGWIKGLERKGHEAARAFYLKAHNGLQDDRVDRVTRESVYIPHLYAVLIGGIQPDGFNQYIREAITGEGSGADGLIQRFQLALVQTLDSVPQGEDRVPDEAAQNTVIEIFIRLDGLTPANLGLPAINLPHLHFSADAQLLFNKWHEEHQRRLLEEEFHHVVESHLSKQAATMPALALAFELLAWASEDQVTSNDSHECVLPDKDLPPRTVSLESAKLAARWIEYLTEHMKYLYAPCLNPGVQGAHAIKKKILQKKLENGFSLRELCRHKWKDLSKQDVVEQAIAILEDCNYLREIPALHIRGGRPPSTRYEINPAVFEVKHGL